MSNDPLRVGARRLTRQLLIEKYEAGHAATLQTLEAMDQGEWVKGVDYPNWDPLLSGHVTIERLFHYPKAHFEAHEEIRRALEKKE